MVVSIDLKKLPARITALIFSLLFLVALVSVVSAEFLVGTLTDNRYAPDYELLKSAVEILPNSGRLLSRLTEAEMRTSNVNPETAENHILRAIKKSPNNYNYRLLLASIREERGNLAGAEQALQDALTLAPNYSQVHWKLANLLIREGKTSEAGEHFRIVAAADPANVPAILDLMWSVSGQDIETLKKITESNSAAEIKLARFLVLRGRIAEAVEAFNRAGQDIAFKSNDSRQLFDSLIKNGYPRIASDLWKKTFSASGEDQLQNNVWNGDLEAEIPAKQAEQFNWQLKNSDYARVGVDDRTAHTGSRSLLLEFTGKDTTRLDNEIRHYIVLSPGVNYQLDFFVKTQDLRTPEGPRITITDKSGKTIGSSEAIPAGTKEWTPMRVNFTAPPKSTDDAAPLFISVKRQPRFVYDDPTKGRIWFDDFAISEVKGK